MSQFATWLVCQVCGRVAERGTEHWLDSPHRTVLDARVVRCPEHWSEWALRNCAAGRTKVMRERAALALQQPAPGIPVNLAPFPTRERMTPEGRNDDGQQQDARRSARRQDADDPHAGTT